MLQPTYDLFMREVYETYRLYQTQIETCWLTEANKYLEQVSTYQEFATKATNGIAENFENKTVQKLTEILDMLKSYRLDSDREMYEKFLEIHRQLKPHVGHPLNSEMYQEALQTIDEFTNSCCETLQLNLDMTQVILIVSRTYNYISFIIYYKFSWY